MPLLILWKNTPFCYARRKARWLQAQSGRYVLQICTENMKFEHVS